MTRVCAKFSKLSPYLLTNGFEQRWVSDGIWEVLVHQAVTLLDNKWLWGFPGGIWDPQKEFNP